MLSIITLANVNWASAQPATNENDACNNKKNGDACEYTGSYNGTPTDKRTGFCDRTNGEVSASRNLLTCKTGQDKNSWTDCVVIGDACKSGSELGVCKGKGSDACNTSEKPPGNPGGSTSPGGTSGGGDNGASPGGTSGGGDGSVTDASSPQTVGFINPSRFNSITELIAGIINALLGILGAITVAVLVASGFKYMIGSNPGEVAQALDGIRNAIVGLMIIMGAFLITQYVISALA